MHKHETSNALQVQVQSMHYKRFQMCLKVSQPTALQNHASSPAKNPAQLPNVNLSINSFPCHDILWYSTDFWIISRYFPESCQILRHIQIFQNLVCFHKKISHILHVRHGHPQICILPEAINYFTESYYRTADTNPNPILTYNHRLTQYISRYCTSHRRRVKLCSHF